MARPNGGMHHSYHEKSRWARGKMEEAVRDGNLEEAQKFDNISSAYKYRENQQSW
jgi:hypothetical protein